MAARMLLLALLLPATALVRTVAAAEPWNASKWELVMLDDAAKTGAVCLDGSPGGYQIRRGAPDSTRWVVFHQGGGWCTSDESCAARANTGLGSSRVVSPYSWGPTYSDPYEGSHLFATPPFDRATLVYALYCDGGSWSGNATHPVSAKPNASAPNQTIYYRGRPLLDALYDHLLDSAGLSSASELLFSGCSAGGLTVYMHADYIANRMPSAVKVAALADAMFSIMTPDVAGQPVYPELMAWIFRAMNSSASVNQACLSAHPDGTACMFGANTAPFVKTPLFVLNSKYDTWQAGGIIGAGKCGNNISSCSNGTKTFWAGYGDKMVETLVGLPPQHGGFLSNCQAHCQAGSGAWEQGTIDGTAMSEAFAGWYNHTMASLGDGAAAAARGRGRGHNASAHRYFETCTITPCAPDRC